MSNGINGHGTVNDESGKVHINYKIHWDRADDTIGILVTRSQANDPYALKSAQDLIESSVWNDINFDQVNAYNKGMIVNELGIYFYYLDEYDISSRLFKQATVYQPFDGVIYANVADALEEAGNVNAALEFLDKAGARLRQEPYLLRTHAFMAMRHGRHDQSLRYPQGYLFSK